MCQLAQMVGVRACSFLLCVSLFSFCLGFILRGFLFGLGPVAGFPVGSSANEILVRESWSKGVFVSRGFEVLVALLLGMWAVFAVDIRDSSLLLYFC
jgi:hypothetical protein